jgi:hypothetical protein
MEAAQSQRRGGIAASSAIVMGGFLASKAIGVVRQSIIAATFGASGQLDAYYAAFKLPDLLLTPPPLSLSLPSTWRAATANRRGAWPARSSTRCCCR